MADPISAVTNSTVAEATDGTSTDTTQLTEAFQQALLKGGLFMIQNLQSDLSETFNDSTSDPDAPF